MSPTFSDFREVLTTAAGNACRCGRSDLAATIASITGSPDIWIRGDLEDVWPDLISELQREGITIHADASPDTVRDQPWGLTTARAAIAETGNVILHENRLEHRSVSLMTESLIVLCPRTELYASLDDAARILREIGSDGHSYATFVSGPSRTADIERQLTIGVQGPGALHVILVDEEDAS